MEQYLQHCCACRNFTRCRTIIAMYDQNIGEIGAIYQDTSVNHPCYRSPQCHHSSTLDVPPIDALLEPH